MYEVCRTTNVSHWEVHASQGRRVAGVFTHTLQVRHVTSVLVYCSGSHDTEPCETD